MSEVPSVLEIHDAIWPDVTDDINWVPYLWTQASEGDDEPDLVMQLCHDVRDQISNIDEALPTARR